MQTANMRLRLSQSKADCRAASESHDDRADSPPPEYRSLGAQLSPRLDAELRAVCASIARNYNPELESSSEVEQHDPIIRYAALSEAVRTEMETAAAAAAATSITTTTMTKTSTGLVQKSYRPPRSRPLIPAGVMNYGSDQYPQQQQDSSSSVARYSYQQEAGDASSAYNPRHTSLVGSRIRQASTHKDPRSRSRSIPLPVAYPGGAHNGEHFEQSNVASARGQSGNVVDFTPQTENSEYQWTSSTAPTSAGVSSPHTSKRTSSNNVQAFQNGTAPVLDSEWMRRELERHKKLQEARLQQEAHEQLVESFIGASATLQYGRSNRITRNPGSQSTTASKRTKEFYFDQCNPAPSNLGRSDSKREFQQPYSNDEQEAQAAGGVPHEESADLRIYFRPESINSPNDPEDEPTRPVSRAESITRRVKDFIRTGSIRRSSTDRRGRANRAQSIESTRSGISTTSVETNASWWRSWKSRPAQSGETLESNGDEITFTGRGRAPTRDVVQQPPRKPAIDLNRQLPPLPSLDQWKDSQDRLPESSPLETASTTDSAGRYADNVLPHSIVPTNTIEAVNSTAYPPQRQQSNRQRSRSIHVEYPPEVAERIRTGDFNTASAASGTLGFQIASPSETAPTKPAILATQKTSHRVRSSSALDMVFNAAGRRSTDESTRVRVRHHSYALSPSQSNGSMPTSATSPVPGDVLEDGSMIPRTYSGRIEKPPQPQAQQPAQMQAQTKRKWWQTGRSRKDSSGTWVERIKSGSRSGFQYPATSSASINSAEAGAISAPSCAIVPC